MSLSSFSLTGLSSLCPQPGGGGEIEPFLCGSLSFSSGGHGLISSAFPSPTTAITVAILVKENSGQPSYQGWVCGRNRVSSGFSESPQWGLLRIQDGRWQAFGYASSYAGIWLAEETSAGGSVGSWKRIVFKFEVGGTSKLFVNAVSRPVTSLATTSFLVVDAGPTIGALKNLSSGTTTAWPGQLGDLRIWNRALSDAEIAAIDDIDGCPTTVLQGEDGRWFCNQGTGTTVPDATSGGNNMTLVNTSWSAGCICPG